MRKKNFFHKIFLNQIALSLLGLAIIFSIGAPLLKNIKKQYSINNEIRALKQEIEEQKNKNLSLNKLISYIKSDEFVEEQARLDLNYKKEGENVVVIKEKDEPKNTAPNSESRDIYNQGGKERNITKRNIANQLKWLNYFLK